VTKKALKIMYYNSTGRDSGVNALKENNSTTETTTTNKRRSK
jgi:hypothetical protein